MPLYPRKRTCAVQTGMSAMGQKRTCAVPQKLNLPDLRIFTSNLLLAQCDQQSPSLIYVLDKRDRCMWRRQRSLNQRSRASGDGDGDNNDTSVARYANMAWRTFNRRLLQPGPFERRDRQRTDRW